MPATDVTLYPKTAGWARSDPTFTTVRRVTSVIERYKSQEFIGRLAEMGHRSVPPIKIGDFLVRAIWKGEPIVPERCRGTYC